IAMMLSYGDNDTYRVGYLQGVGGIRTDVRVVNWSLLSSERYMWETMEKMNDGDALPLNLDPERRTDGVRDVIYYYDYEIPRNVDLRAALEIMLSDDPENKMQTQSGENINILPTKNLKLQVDKQAVLTNKAVPTICKIQL